MKLSREVISRIKHYKLKLRAVKHGGKLQGYKVYGGNGAFNTLRFLRYYWL